MSVVTRIAPSPTGQMHIGTVRTALFNYLYAKKFGGTYFVRIEDTDKERNRPEWTEAISKDFEWVGLIPDATYITSDHLERHKELLHKIVAEDKAYVSREPRKDHPDETVEVVRLRNPGRSITFTDVIRGDVTVDTSDLGDFVIARAIDDPLYHFAVVVDDGDAGVTHAIRAEEHISNTPRQILILEALGFTRPVYAHIPLILAPDRSKLSKRKHAASIDIYREKGYLPSAILNYLVLLGWNPGTDQEIFTLDEMIEQFSLEKVHQAGAIFNEVKLKWFNQQYIQKLSVEDFSGYVKTFLPGETYSALEGAGMLEKLIPIMRSHIQTFGELKTMAEAGEFEFYTKTPEYKQEMLFWKDEKDANETRRRLTAVLALLNEVTDSDWHDVKIKEILWPFAEKEGRGAVLWPLRVCLSGREKSPDPFQIAGIMGKDETITRIKRAISVLGE